MFLISRKSREKRERPGPMNLSHTDYLGLTQTTQNSQNGCVASLAATGFAECTHPGWLCERSNAPKSVISCAFCVKKTLRKKGICESLRSLRETKKQPPI